MTGAREQQNGEKARRRKSDGGLLGHRRPLAGFLDPRRSRVAHRVGQLAHELQLTSIERDRRRESGGDLSFHVDQYPGPIENFTLARLLGWNRAAA